jgi:VCBS repeat-containing protein
MTNRNPTFTSSAASGSFSENSNTTGSGSLHQLTGTMKFKDSDRLDSHTTSAVLRTVSWTGGSTIPSSSLVDLNTAMSSTILTDSNGSGELRWSFSAADSEFDFLARHERLVLTYDIFVNDNHGGTAKRTVTVTITGTDDRPVIEFGTTAEVTEQAGQTLSLSHDTANIAVNFVDPDLNNTGHTATVIGVSAAGVTTGLLPGFLGEIELRSFFHVDNVVKAAGSSTGTINTTFSAPDLAFDYLAEGETLDITYTLRLNDQAGGTSNQTVVVTVVGTNDGPVYLSGPDFAGLTEGEDLSPAGNLTASGDFHFADVDLSDTHTVATSVTATRSGGGAVPLTEAELLAALTTAIDVPTAMCSARSTGTSRSTTTT